MRLLHTSDWHLGRAFHRVGLLDAQAAVVDHLVSVVRSERVDAVVVAGDVYDRALPPVDAVALCDEALTRLSAAGASVVVLAGNHDSAARLRFGSRLLERAGVHLRADPARAADPVLLADEHGPVAVYPVPYLDPVVAAGVVGAAERTHRSVLSTVLDAVRADLARRPAGTRSVVSAHAFVTGGAASESERDVGVGGLGDVPVGLFGGVDYVALGHLHGPQRLAHAVRYSGSPLPYSFSESSHRKCSWLVELGPRGLGHVEAVPVPQPRALALLEGTLPELLADPALSRHEADLVSVTLHDAVRPDDAIRRLQSRFPGAVVLRWQPPVPGAQDGGYAQRLAGRDDAAVVGAFAQHVRGAGLSPGEAALVAAALEDGRRAAAGDGTPSRAVAVDGDGCGDHATTCPGGRGGVPPGGRGVAVAA